MLEPYQSILELSQPVITVHSGLWGVVSVLQPVEGLFTGLNAQYMYANASNIYMRTVLVFIFLMALSLQFSNNGESFPFDLKIQNQLLVNHNKNAEDASSIPRSRSSLGGEMGNPPQYSCWENLMDKGPWRARVHRVTKCHT